MLFWIIENALFVLILTAWDLGFQIQKCEIEINVICDASWIQLSVFFLLMFSAEKLQIRV